MTSEQRAREIWQHEAETAPRVNGCWDMGASVIRAMLAFREEAVLAEREACVLIVENEPISGEECLRPFRHAERKLIAVAIRARSSGGEE